VKPFSSSCKAAPTEDCITNQRQAIERTERDTTTCLFTVFFQHLIYVTSAAAVPLSSLEPRRLNRIGESLITCKSTTKAFQKHTQSRYKDSPATSRRSIGQVDGIVEGSRGRSWSYPPPHYIRQLFVFESLTSDADSSRQYSELAPVSEEIPTFVTSIIHSFGERSIVARRFHFSLPH